MRFLFTLEVVIVNSFMVESWCFNAFVQPLRLVLFRLIGHCQKKQSISTTGIHYFFLYLAKRFFFLKNKMLQLLDKKTRIVQIEESKKVILNQTTEVESENNDMDVNQEQHTEDMATGMSFVCILNYLETAFGWRFSNNIKLTTF